MSNNDIQSLTDENYSGEDFSEAFKKFEQLPSSYKIMVLRVFSNQVDACMKKHLHDEVVKVCEERGHDFSEWRKYEYSKTIKNPYWGSRDHVVTKEFISDVFTKWERSCARCGLYESQEQEPQELVDQRNEGEKQARIRTLESELNSLKNS